MTSAEFGLQEKDFCFGKLKDIDMKKRTVVGYLSSFDNIDRDGDVITKGAFKKSLQERKSEIRFLNQHEWKQPHGYFSELEEDDYGLYFVSNPLIDTTFSSDLLKMYEAEIIDEHSIGFEVVKKEFKQGIRYINEIKLYEGSNVTMAANPLAKLREVKSMNKEDALKSLKREEEKILKAFRVGDFTDETYILFELALKQCQKMAFEIGKFHSEPTIVTPEPIQEQLKVLKEFNTTF